MKQHSRALPRRVALTSLAGAALAGATALNASAAERHGRTVRFATFNASLNRSTQGALLRDLSTPDDAQARNAAETIQRVDPDVLLINEFDHDDQGAAVRLFLRNYLAVGHNGARPVRYPYRFTAPVNTGVATGVDLDGRNGAVTTPGSDAYGQDAFGYGWFPGQYGMVVLSKHPIDTRAVRTFQHFLWKDMPGNVMPEGYYSDEARAILRLSSKSHWDVPVRIGRETVHFLVSHPTPPTFDGPEDRNGRRNHDEIRLWADYIGGRRRGAYLYDRPWPARRAAARGAVRDRGRPERRFARRRQLRPRRAAAAGAPCGAPRRHTPGERGRRGGGRAPGRREHLAPRRPGVRHRRLRRHGPRQPARRPRHPVPGADTGRERRVLAGAGRSAVPAGRRRQNRPDVGPPPGVAGRAGGLT